MSLSIPAPLRRVTAAIGADLPGAAGMPRPTRFLAATVAAVLLSIAGCAAVAAVTRAVAPSLAGYDHLDVTDWGRLTVIGVVIASLGWPAAGAIWSRARRPFLVLTMIVTAVSLAPDLWILRQGQPAGGVQALVVMHVVVAVATYPSLVPIAPQRRLPSTALVPSTPCPRPRHTTNPTVT